MIFRSLLFVPGARPDRFDKAAKAGADAVIIDLEDAVLPEDKARAREKTLSWLAARETDAACGVRTNSLRTADGCADVAALAAYAGKTPDFVMIPKAETAQDVEIVGEVLAGIPLIAVIESGRGLGAAYEIAEASNGGVLFGGADFSASLGATLSDWDAMAHARGVIASACGAAGVPAYDVPYLDIKDADGLQAATEKVRAFGFSGRACIHPAQVDTVSAVFTPNSDAVAEAQAILAAFEAAKGGAVLHNGKLVDRPIILAAERVLACAKS